MSIIVILSIVKGLQNRSLEWVNETGGTRMITMSRNWSFQNNLNLSTVFTQREFEFIKDNIPEVEAIASRKEAWGNQISVGANMSFALLHMAMPAYEIISEWKADQGRFINNLDYREGNDVVVLGTTLVTELFGSRNPIGQYVSMRGRRLQVIGIMEHKFMEPSGGINFGNQNPLEYYNRIAIIPLTTAIHKMGFSNELEVISIRAFSEQQAREIAPLLRELLLQIRKGQEVFRVQSGAERADDLDIDIMFKVIFYFITVISLLVGGIVIMNILLASIKERTREIGIRITVGARQIDIFLQFLVQSIVITFVGGLVGVFIALGIVDYVGGFLNMPTAIDFGTIILALMICVCVGLFFGIYPAIKASKLDPVKALRVD